MAGKGRERRQSSLVATTETVYNLSKMPKRKNPFGESAPIQLKTHVGFRQAATEEEKQNVYGK